MITNDNMKVRHTGGTNLESSKLFPSNVLLLLSFS